MSDSLDDWFRREILVHEASLKTYLRRIWRSPQDIDDLRQEIYVRVYEAAARGRPVSPKAFLFATGHHLVVSRFRRTRVVSIESVGDFEDAIATRDELSPERRLDSRQQLRRLADVLNSLPPRCRQVIWLRKIDALSQKEVAERLGISVRTVECHIRTGMRLLAAGFLGQSAIAALTEDDAPQIDAEDQHGKR
ncbi:RNA polymerase sigma factor [Steroidobacter sp.]|uniref:RNA polymerase sigma factor n=1 Tax=Steroidobacter sp. TaxID=1978227 RepID=UPI001A592655|nr:RNA polymerase sigma factor [Steroidobacter sp.]MBL8270902.1 RNA polymerase sigma factor [Steroidobacter sp.]